MNKRLLIATGIYPPDIGGPATYLSQTIPFLRAKGIEVSVVTYGAVSDEYVDERGVRVITVNRNASVVTKLFQYYRAVRRNVRKADLVYLHDIGSAGLATYLANLFVKKTYFVRIGGDFVWEQAFQKGETTLSYTAFSGAEKGKSMRRRRVANMILNNARYIIVPSEFLKNVVCTWGVCDDERVRVIPNAVLLTQMTKTTEDVSHILSSMRLHRDNKKKILVASGRFVNWKHFDLLIAAMQEVSDTVLYIIGSGEEEGRYRAYIATHQLEDRVTIKPTLSREALYTVLKHADLFVLPSEGDTFSFVALEAYCAGTPLLLARYGALPEIFGAYEHRGVSFLEEITSEHIAKCIQAASCYESPKEADQLSIQKMYSIDAHCKVLYDTIMTM